MKIATYSKPLAALFATAAIAFSASAEVEIISADPMPGNVDELSTVTIGLSSFAVNSEGEADYSFITIKDEDGKSYSYTATGNQRQATIVVTLDEAITTAGTYTLTIPEGTLLSMSYETNDEIELVYNVTGSTGDSSESEYKLTWGTPEPAPGTVNSIPTSITIPSTSTVSLSIYGVDSSALKITGPDGDVAYKSFGLSRSGSAYIYLNEEITAPGEYTFTIPEGWAVDTNGKGVSPELSFTYTVVEALPDLEVQCNPDPEEELYSLSEFKVIVDGYSDLSLVNESSTLATVSKDGKQVTRAFVSLGTFSMGRVSFPCLDFELFEPLTEAGVYNINLPSGSIIDNETEELLGAINITYTILEAPVPNFTFTPSNEGTVASLVGTIDIALTDYTEGGIYFTNGIDSVTATVTDSDDEVVATFPVAYGETGHVKIEIAEDDAITKGGYYTVSIPSGAISNFEDTPLGAISFTYYVGKEYTVSIDPKEGTVESLGDFTVTFDGIDLVKASDTAGPKDYPYYATVGANGSLTKVAQMRANTFAANNTMSIGIQSGTVTEAGDYAIVIPAAYYTVDGGQPKEDLVFYYTIAAKEVTFFCEPRLVNPEEDADVESLDSIEFAFQAVDENWEDITEGITYKHDSTKAPTLALVSTDTWEVVEYNNGTVSGTDPNLVWSSYYGVNTNGAYLFTIPDGYMTATDADGNTATSDEMMAMFYLTKKSDGVTSISFQKLEKGAIYNLNGVKVGTDVNNLPAGIYIMNGKKVVIK